MKLNFKNISIDVILLSIYGVGKFYLGLIFMILSLGLFYSCGNDLLYFYGNIQRTFIFTIVIFILEIALAIGVYKLRTDVFKFGVWIIVISSVIPVSYLGYHTSLRSVYYEDFDREKWLDSEKKPIKMISTLVYESELIGQSKTEIINKLGPGEISQMIDSTQLYYETDAYTLSPLILTFENDTLVIFNLECLD